VIVVPVLAAAAAGAAKPIHPITPASSQRRKPPLTDTGAAPAEARRLHSLTAVRNAMKVERVVLAGISSAS
jgi:hypothetical protein